MFTAEEHRTLGRDVDSLTRQWRNAAQRARQAAQTRECIRRLEADVARLSAENANLRRLLDLDTAPRPLSARARPLTSAAPG